MQRERFQKGCRKMLESYKGNEDDIELERYHRRHTTPESARYERGFSSVEWVVYASLMFAVLTTGVTLGHPYVAIFLTAAIALIGNAIRKAEVRASWSRKLSISERTERTAKVIAYEKRNIAVLDTMPVPENVTTSWGSIYHDGWKFVRNKNGLLPSLELAVTGITNSGNQHTELIRIWFHNEIPHEDDRAIEWAAEEAKGALQSAITKIKTELVILE
jgi:hypothetical protein